MRPTMLPSSWAASSLIHASAFGALVLGAHRAAPPVPRPEVVEFRMEPAPPSPPPPEPAPTVAPQTTKDPVAAKASPVTTAPRAAAPAPKPTDATEATPSGPLDFTGAPVGDVGSFTMTAGAGLGGGGGGSRPGPPSPAAPAPAGPRIVPRDELSRPPSPPDLSGRLLASYPRRAREAGETGSATLSLVVLADGSVTALEVRRATSPELGRACLDTVRGSRWQSPLDKTGRPTGTRVGYTCTFDVR